MSRSVFLVQRRALVEGCQVRLRADRPNLQPFVPVRLFSDRAAAEALRDEIERTIRETTNPFDLGHDPTSMGATEFVNRLWGLGVTPPQPDVGRRGKTYHDTDWRAWWRETAPGLTLEQIEGVWGLLDRLRLVEVVELPLDRRE